jgi:phosphatidylserine/phosphatidylglycerophosphate/cardiolipin synthase-like enzyme
MPYHEEGPHDFMHNKVLVVDQQVVVTGSFNFSQNAIHNAENIITLYDETIARQYGQYIESLISKYR